MRTTEMVLFAHFLKTSKFIPACISIYILSLDVMYATDLCPYAKTTDYIPFMKPNIRTRGS